MTCRRSRPGLAPSARRWATGWAARCRRNRGLANSAFGTPRGGRRTVPSRSPSPAARGVPRRTMRMLMVTSSRACRASHILSPRGAGLTSAVPAQSSGLRDCAGASTGRVKHRASQAAPSATAGQHVAGMVHAEVDARQRGERDHAPSPSTNPATRQRSAAADAPAAARSRNPHHTGGARGVAAGKAVARQRRQWRVERGARALESLLDPAR